MEDAARVRWPVTLIATLFALAALVMVLKDGGSADPSPKTKPASVELQLKDLPASTTHATIAKAPLDQDPNRVPAGAVVHPKRTTALYDKPEGKPFAKLKTEEFGDVWLPVIARNRSWVQVLLPSKPNGSTGWVKASELEEAHSRFLVTVHLDDRSLELFENDKLVGTWTVAIGASGTPTPVGRTFVLGQIEDDKQPFSPVIMPLGSHSETLDTYGGGPGTVALHGWTDPSVFGKAISHGCVRVPDDALDLLRTVPLGTPVMVSAT